MYTPYEEIAPLCMALCGTKLPEKRAPAIQVALTWFVNLLTPHFLS